MDDIVKAALAKWPHVPDCRGWLGLDARGDWYMRDDRTQAAGPFPRPKGSRIQHEKLRQFIERNYEADAQGAWYFQNGPQRVYVELEAAPFVWRLQARPEGLLICGHDGRPAQLRHLWEDDDGRLFQPTDRGFALVHSQDMDLAADQVLAGRWVCTEQPFAAMPSRFGYQLSPAGAVPGAHPRA